MLSYFDYKFFKLYALAICFGVLFSIFVIGEAAAKTYYIAPTGNDTTGDGSIGNPWKKLQKAHDDANGGAGIAAGDTIHCRGGTYFGQTTIWTASGSDGSPITVQAYTGETPVFNGGRNGSNFLTIDGGDYITIDGLDIRVSYENGVWMGDNGSGSTATNIIVRNCSIKDMVRNGVYMSWRSSDLEIYNNFIERTSPPDWTGILAWHSTSILPAARRVNIHNNILIGFAHGISLGSGATDINIYNNTLYNNRSNITLLWGDWGEFINKGGQTGTFNVTIKNNISYGASYTVTELKVQNPSNNPSRNLITDNNLYYKFGGSAVINWAGTNYSLSQYQANTGNAASSIQGNPLFVAAGSDFHLKSTSPAIGLGAYEFSVNSFLAPPSGLRIK